MNRSAPAATVVPVLVYEDVAKAIEWLCGAFGFAERLRYIGRDGRVTHAQLSIAEGAVMLGARGAEFSRTCRVRVPDRWAAAIWLERLVMTFVFRGIPHDPYTYGRAAAVLLTLGLVAALVPARRAARVDPLAALKAE